MCGTWQKLKAMYKEISDLVPPLSRLSQPGFVWGSKEQGSEGDGGVWTGRDEAEQPAGVHVGV